MRLRGPREIAFRLHQRVAQFADFALPPPPNSGMLHPLPLPDPQIVRAALTGSNFERSILALAAEITHHRFPLLGFSVNTGDTIDWRRDYVSGISSPRQWWRKIPFLDASKVGDHKIVWELNRHQHLIVLAQAWLLSGDERYLREIENQIESWCEQNPYIRSINWASALEIAFRALSWLWVLHLAGTALNEGTRALIHAQLHRHGLAIQHNLSTYFAPNTHILGEGVILHALGIALGLFAWKKQGARIVEQQRLIQIQPDGFHFEQSSYYHLYTLDMLVFHYLLSGRPESHRESLRKLASCLAAIVDTELKFPLLGDDDGGRFFHPYGARESFAQSSLATCACLFPDLKLPAESADLPQQALWWLGPVSPPQQAALDQTVHLSACGVTAIREQRVFLTFDCGPFGAGSAGHSHADTLALTLKFAGQEILIDPGTYSYTGDPISRDWFRGTFAHSTVRLGGHDQARPAHAFRWEAPPKVRRVATGPASATGECSYRGQTHRRTINLNSASLEIVDDFTELTSNCAIEQNWHLAFLPRKLDDRKFQVGPCILVIDSQLSPEIVPAFRSHTYGQKEPSFILSCKTRAPLASALATSIIFPEPSWHEST